MQPKTKIEKEVVRLGAKLKPLSQKQERWAVKHCTSVDNAYKLYNRRHNDVQQFLVVTTCDGWQVIRHFYIYSHFAYHKLKSHYIREVMRQWFRSGDYVFLARDRAQGWYNDGWIWSRPMSIKRGYEHCSCLNDPRDLSYEGVYFARIAPQFSYLPKNTAFPIDYLYRAANASPYCETLLKNNREALKWCFDNGFAYDKQKMAAVKIAIRYNYPFTDSLWRDLVEMLRYLGRDLHNPALVCPLNLREMHDKVSKMASNRRKKVANKMARLQEIAREKAELRHLQALQQREAENRKRAKDLASVFKRKRARFFGIHLECGNIVVEPLKSVDDFFEEGKELCHCVFANGYYDVNKKPYCLIMSAKVEGKRTETLEIDLSTYQVLQCRGKYNVNSPYHQRILDLVIGNMEEIKRCNGAKKKGGWPTSHV